MYKIIALLVVALISLGCVSSFMFEVRPAEEKCMIEEFRKDTLVSGKFEVSDRLSKNVDYPTELVMANMQLRFYIRDPTQQLLFDNHDAKNGPFAFTAQDGGEYYFCFTDNYKPHASVMPLSRTVSLEIKTGADANDYTDLMNKGHLKLSEVELKKIEDSVDKIKEEVLYMKTREETMRNTNESTNARVAWLAVFCIIVLIGTGAFQINYLKRYFKQRKLI
ncbi:emp24/gp25L/p24 family protein [Cavenderia fasciculata]|uniref:Emp24/gp25L/p24 family protein n=1 Tax=Cavenderia fasciculata TaxID=261658 RepID=F4PU90_CACFS|nr:emp24/gp25L/p24 family protein [Cavenderia fasciculata]EGG21805.1 emp24/gp25L/p24 family protein [Cavenderia fasciculata]|eukprot:XP_004359655.1 emp24/gp25L/p24 family protein [Cavenderia fasciculata]